MKAYVGLRAKNYEQRRRTQPTWQPEQDFVAEQVQGATTVIDCPVGTGRFLPIYKAAGIDVLGVDVSADMLAQAARRDYGRLENASLFDLDPGEERRDLAVCVRFLNWLSIADVERALQRLSLCAGEIVASVRLSDNHPPKSIGNTIVHDAQAFEQILGRLELEVSARKVIHRGKFGDYHMIRIGPSVV